jgi:hypothetical protein
MGSLPMAFRSGFIMEVITPVTRLYTGSLEIIIKPM